MTRFYHVNQVPDDYPYIDAADSSPRARPDYQLVECEGRLYPVGNTPFERWMDWIYSELLVEHFVQQCPVIKNEEGTRMSEEDIIARCYEGVVAEDGHYGTEARLKWVFRRVANLLGWPVPKVCNEQDH